MSNNSNPLEWMRRLPTWILGAIAFVTAVVSFVNLLLGNFPLGITILGILIFASLLFTFIYLSFSTTQSVVLPGRRIYRFGQYRSWTIAGIVLVVLILAILLALKPVRVIIVTAFVGTPTPTPTLTLTPPPVPRSTPSPTPPVTHTSTPTLAEKVIATSTPTSTPTATPTSTGTPTATFTPTSTPTPTIDCIPSDLSELPPQSIAIIESLESGEKSQVAFSTLRYEHGSRLTLASGIAIDFKKMKSFELSNPGFTTDFAADIVITFLDCTTYSDRIQSWSHSLLTGETELGPLSLHILKVKRVDFQW